MTIITKNSRQTQKVAELLARQILEERPFSASKAPRLPLIALGTGRSGQAVILALRGDLGAGKTTFIQGFAKGLGVKEKILSPTFVILKRFKITKCKTRNAKRKTTARNSKIADFKNLYHLDCYRVESPQEILDLGFKDIISDPQNIVIIEWAERIKKILPKSAIWLDFEWVDKNKRKITIRI